MMRGICKFGSSCKFNHPNGRKAQDNISDHTTTCAEMLTPNATAPSSVPQAAPCGSTEPQGTTSSSVPLASSLRTTSGLSEPQGQSLITRSVSLGSQVASTATSHSMVIRPKAGFEHEETTDEGVYQKRKPVEAWSNSNDFRLWTSVGDGLLPMVSILFL